MQIGGQPFLNLGLRLKHEMLRAETGRASIENNKSAMCRIFMIIESPCLENVVLAAATG